MLSPIYARELCGIALTAAPLSLNDTCVRCGFSDGTPPDSYNPNCMNFQRKFPRLFSVIEQLYISENVCLYLLYCIILLAINQFLAAAAIPRAGPARKFRAAREYLHVLRLASELADKRYAVGLEFAKQTRSGAV